MLRFCFMTLGLAASLCAAELEPGVPADATRIVATVRPDASTGRLIRRVVVQPKSAVQSQGAIQPKIVAPIVVKETREDEQPAVPPIPLAADASLVDIIEHTAK